MTTMTEAAALTQWLRSLSRSAIRLLEEPLPITLADGRRLRGVELVPGELVLSRERVLYARRNGAFMPLTEQEALSRWPFEALRDAFRRACERAAERTRRRAAYLERL